MQHFIRRARIVVVWPVLVASIAVPSVAAPLLLDIGPGAKAVDKGYAPLAPDEAYSPARGYGWVPETQGTIRFSYSDDFRDPAKWRRDASQVEGDTKFVSPNKRYQTYVGALPGKTQGSFVYEFRFPAPIESVCLFDLHTVWGHKPLNKVTMWTSPDGRTWTERHKDPARYFVRNYAADLSEEFRGKASLFVKYHFASEDEGADPERSGARLDWFGLRGTLQGELPHGYNPTDCLAVLSGAPFTAGPFEGKGDALTCDGALIVNRATLRADLPPGRYYVEAVSNPADYAILHGGKPVTASTFPAWRNEDGIRTVAGRVEHAGGPLVVDFQSKGEVIELRGVRILPDRPSEWPARMEAGRIVLARPTDDPAALRGLRDWEAAGFTHSPDIMKELARTFSDVKEGDLRAALVALAGIQPNVQADAPETRQTIAALREVLRSDPLSITARDLLDDLGRILAGDRKYQDHWWEDVPRDSVLHPVLQAVKGRYFYNEWAEGGRSEARLSRFMPFVEEALKTYPKDIFLRMYHLERVPWGEEYMAGAEGAPRWAALQRELTGRCLHVIRWWAARQRRDGSFSGRLNDDVEALRAWPIAILALNDAKVQTAARRLSDGIWKSGELVNGYSRTLWDIQHSSEESSDSQPQFIGVCYGDPEWIVRNMMGLSCMRDVWTDINPHGYRHFKSAYVSATEIDTTRNRAVDVPYATRAVKSGHWLTWYAPYPEAVALMTEWARAWAAASLRADDGKPRGVPPAAVDFQTGRLGGKGPNWYTPDLGWTYFNWPGMVNAILEQMLLAWDLTGDAQYAQPFTAMLELIGRHRDPPAAPPEPGTEAWVVSKLLGREFDPSGRGGDSTGSLWAVFGKWRVLTGDARFDDLLKRVGDPYIRFYLTGDTSAMESAMESALEKGVNRFGLGAMRYNLPMLTTEVKYTDRIFIGGHALLYAMYTGAPGEAQYCPAHAVTWRNAGHDFAALVERADRAQVRVRAFNFGDKQMNVGMALWRLPRGTYRLACGPEDDAAPRDERQVVLSERGQAINISVPPRKIFTISLSLLAEDKVPAALPDLAVALRDLRLSPARPKAGEETTLFGIVHNIGAADAPAARARFVAEYPDGDRTISETALPPLPRPRSLKPSTQEVSTKWTWPEKAPRSIRLEVMCDAPQITISNDRTEIILERKEE